MMAKMSWLAKSGLVVGGYVTACLIAGGIVYVWEMYTQDASAQASAGMYAGGDFLLFISVCGVLALIPTAQAAYFLVRKILTR